MDEKIREKMVLALENAVRVAGAKDYEDGMRQATNLIEFARNGAQSIQTIEGLRTVLDSCPPMSRREEKIVLVLMNQLPQVLRIGFMVAAAKAKATLPPPTGGRPRATTASKTQEVLDFVSELFRKGSRLRVAQTRAANKYGLSLRTIERLWSNRESILEDEPTIDDGLRFIQTAE
jgi:hypothetical protein